MFDRRELRNKRLDLFGQHRLGWIGEQFSGLVIGQKRGELDLSRGGLHRVAEANVHPKVNGVTSELSTDEDLDAIIPVQVMTSRDDTNTSSVKLNAVV